MSTKKRGRACTACASIKIKCQLGSETDLEPPCDRCLRLGKECILSQPKRQKNQVAELEAQVAALTRLLQAQGIQDPILVATQSSHDTGLIHSSPSASLVETNGTAKKRRFLNSSHDISSKYDISTSSPPLHDEVKADLAELDMVVSCESQELVLNRYFTVLLPQFPMVPIAGKISLEALRQERPVLLLSIIYAASPGLLAAGIQDDVTQLLLRRLAQTKADQSERVLEIIQAIQIACLWSRAPKQHKHIAFHQLIPIATQLADKVGICDMLATPSFVVAPQMEGLEAIDALRTWLCGFHLSLTMACLRRAPNFSPEIRDEKLLMYISKPNAMIAVPLLSSEKKNQHEQCLFSMDYDPTALFTDRWLMHYSRGERLCADITDLMSLNDSSVLHDVSESGTKILLQTCRSRVLDWKLKIPQAVRTPTLLFWEHVAMAHMYEVILHTPTNKHSFAAPFVVENMSCSDFAAPAITPDHITAAYELLTALHAIIDIVTTLGAETMMTLPNMVYGKRASYANYMLGKFFIAVTAPGNTLGSILDIATLRMEEYCEKLIDLGMKAKAIDERCAPAQMLVSALRLRDAYIMLQSNTWTRNNPLGNISATGITADGRNEAPSDLLTTDWMAQFDSCAPDVGLDSIFAEDLPSETLIEPWSLQAPYQHDSSDNG